MGSGSWLLAPRLEPTGSRAQGDRGDQPVWAVPGSSPVCVVNRMRAWRSQELPSLASL